MRSGITTYKESRQQKQHNTAAATSTHLFERHCIQELRQDALEIPGHNASGSAAGLSLGDGHRAHALRILLAHGDPLRGVARLELGVVEDREIQVTLRFGLVVHELPVHRVVDALVAQNVLQTSNEQCTLCKKRKLL